MATYISTRFVYTHKLWKFPLISSLFLSCSTVRRKIPFFQHSCILMYPSKSSVMHHDGFSCAIFFFYQAHALQAQTNICTFFKQTIDLSSLFWKKKIKINDYICLTSKTMTLFELYLYCITLEPKHSIRCYGIRFTIFRLIDIPSSGSIRQGQRTRRVILRNVNMCNDRGNIFYAIITVEIRFTAVSMIFESSSNSIQQLVYFTFRE